MTTALQTWFARPQFLWLLAVLPALGLVGLWARRKRRRAMAELGAGVALAGLRARRSERLKAIAALLGSVLLVVGIAGPQWGRDWSQSVVRGRDLVVVLDVSRSMLAENPSRIEQAQRALLGLCDKVSEVGGHRLGLVVFARNAKLVCPLSNDYRLFRESVKYLDADHLDPELKAQDNDVSGTRIGEALMLAVDAHRPNGNGAQDILLVSDGDDPASAEPGRRPEWQDGIDSARARGIPVHVVGVGDPDHGWPIPLRHEEVREVRVAGVPIALRIARNYQRHGGKDVLTRMNEPALDTIARRTGGRYVRSGVYPLGELYLTQLATGDEREHGEDALPVYHQWYAWFLTPAFGLIGLTLLLGDGRRVGT